MTTSFSVPSTTPADGGWETYDAPIRIDATSATGLRPGTDTPEAAVAHFYAALVRGDDDYEEVIPEDDAGGMLARKLETLTSWSFDAVELRARRLRGQARASIRIWAALRTSRGESQSTDEVEVRRQDDGRWLVTRPPT